MIGKGWLLKHVRVYAAYDHRKEHAPMAEGQVIAYIDGPSVIVRDSSGNDTAWPISLPIEETE